MAKFEDHSPSENTNLLICGGSGSGKTGGLAFLANAGYKVRILTNETSGVDILHDVLTDEGKKNVSWITLKDTKQNTAWGQFMNIRYNGWKDEDEDLGLIEDWDGNTVLCIDTLDGLGKASMRATLKKAGINSKGQPRIQDYGDAQRNLLAEVDALTAEDIKCIVIFNAHIKASEDDYGKVKNYPATIGTAASMEVGELFNNVFRIDSKPSGEKVYRTTSDVRMDLKSSRPSKLKKEEPFNLLNLVKIIQS